VAEWFKAGLIPQGLEAPAVGSNPTKCPQHAMFPLCFGIGLERSGTSSRCNRPATLRGKCAPNIRPVD